MYIPIDRCDILIDSIQRIAIKTTTRELLVEEAPEEFQILAYDQEGNVFSSLGGLKFHWSIHPDDENRMQKFAPESIITFVKFADSNYEADDVIKVLFINSFGFISRVPLRVDRMLLVVSAGKC